MQRSDTGSSAKLVRPIRTPEIKGSVSTILLMSVLLLFATCSGTPAPAKENNLHSVADIGSSEIKHHFALTKLQHAVAAIIKDQTQVYQESSGAQNQVSVHNVTQGLVPNSQVNVWYCSNNPGTGIQFTSVEIEDYPLRCKSLYMHRRFI